MPCLIGNRSLASAGPYRRFSQLRQVETIGDKCQCRPRVATDLAFLPDQMVGGADAVACIKIRNVRKLSLF